MTSGTRDVTDCTLTNIDNNQLEITIETSRVRRGQRVASPRSGGVTTVLLVYIKTTARPIAKPTRHVTPLTPGNQSATLGEPWQADLGQ